MMIFFLIVSDGAKKLGHKVDKFHMTVVTLAPFRTATQSHLRIKHNYIEN